MSKQNNSTDSSSAATINAAQAESKRTIADTLEAMNPQYPPAESGLENIVVPD